jgi:hypothetical protein
MADDRVHIALFREDAIDAAADAVTQLRKIGIYDQDISVITGIPYSDKILGRPMTWTRIPLIAMAGAVMGVGASLALNLGTPLLYPLRVGGMPYLPIPTTIVLTFELGMLGMLLSTFLGVLVETMIPTYGPKGYHPKITDGHIGILFSCKPELDELAHSSMQELGGEMIHQSEVEVQE